LRLEIYGPLVADQVFKEAEPLFRTDLLNSGPFRVSLTAGIHRLYARLFSDELFIPEAAKAFAVIAMRLICSLNQFAIDAPPEILPFFPKDLAKLREILVQSTPDFMRGAMAIALDSLTETAAAIRAKSLSQTSERFINKLAYMDEMQLILFQGPNKEPISRELVAAAGEFTNWAAREGAELVDGDFLDGFLARVLEVFWVKSQETLERVTRDAEGIARIRNSTVSVDGVRMRLKTDFEYIATLGKGRVDVTGMAIHGQLKEFFQPPVVKDVS
jgi:hypothetical protein